MGLRAVREQVALRRLNTQVEFARKTARLPRHVGVILDGNRRWARQVGVSIDQGYQAGARKVTELAGWCDAAGVEIVTVWLLSTDNLNREPQQLEGLLGIIEGVIRDLAACGRWRLRAVGALELLPERTRQVVDDAVARTIDAPGMTINLAVGYGGRRELTDAVAALLRERAAAGASLAEVADQLTGEDIAKHLYTGDQPDPDLVIRTSGEVRLSGFLLWQSAHSEFYFCDPFWPAFSHADFLRAICAYAARQRRYGS